MDYSSQVWSAFPDEKAGFSHINTKGRGGKGKNI